MAASAIATRPTNDQNGLMFYRETRPITPAAEETFEPGAISRFYRFVYPNLPTEQRTHGDCLEALMVCNSWLR